MKRHRSQTLRSIYVAVVVVLLIVSAVAFVQLRRRSEKRVENGVYRATFSDANDWVALGGSWTQRFGEVTNTTEERGAKLIRRHGLRGNYEVDSDIQMDDPHGDAGLILRSGGAEEGVDSYRGYLALIRPSEGVIEFGRVDFGWQVLARQYFKPQINTNGWLHFRVMAVGCKFVFEVTFTDGSFVSTEAEDPSCFVAGRTGLRSSLTSARWRNFKIQPENEEDLKVFQAAAHPGAGSQISDNLEINPTPETMERYISAMRQEALKHVLPKNVQSISGFSGAPGRGPEVTIVGTVISTPPLLIVQDTTGSIVVSSYKSQSSLKLGDMVEVHAMLVREGLGRHLENAKIRVLWSDIPAPPLAVTASQLNDGTYRGFAITVEGTLISATATPGGYELILTDQNYVFCAVGSDDFRTDLSGLQPGSRLRLRGVATVSGRFTKNIYPFAVITDRVDVLSGPPWWSTRHLLWIMAGLVAVFASILFFLHRLQQWRTQSVLREREQLALEMHDTLAQSFTGIGYQLQAAHQEKRGEKEIQVHILSALQMVKISHKEASRTIASLRPQYRSAAAIVACLKESAEKLSDGGDLTISDSLHGPDLVLPLVVTDAFFRIGQEAIANAIQHGQCRTLTIRLDIDRKHARLTIADDGKGFNVEAVYEGLGLGGMKSRASTAKIDFDIHSSSTEGTIVLLRAKRSAANGLFPAALRMLQAFWKK